MEVLERLQAARQTILLITHERAMAAHASRQIHLLDGMIEQDGDRSLESLGDIRELQAVILAGCAS